MGQSFQSAVQQMQAKNPVTVANKFPALAANEAIAQPAALAKVPTKKTKSPTRKPKKK